MTIFVLVSTVGHISSAWYSLVKGLSLTLRHFSGAARRRSSIRIMDPGYFSGQNGIATIEFPHEQIPVPETGRYKLHNEIDDCIVCDKCAKICPVNCISIEAIRSAEEFGRTSDGTPKRIYASRFDIDMAKCCFCGLCTTVCPTECLTMTPDFDYSTFNIIDHVVGFGNMSEPDIALKRKEWEEHIAQKTTTSAATAEQAKPVLRTGFKPKIQPPQGS